MENQERLHCACKRNSRRCSKLTAFSFTLLVLVSNINSTDCYSNVRRSGSTAAIDELKKASMERVIPNISPMVKPIVHAQHQNINEPVKNVDASKSNHQRILNVDSQNTQAQRETLQDHMQNMITQSGHAPRQENVPNVINVNLHSQDEKVEPHVNVSNTIDPNEHSQDQTVELNVSNVTSHQISTQEDFSNLIAQNSHLNHKEHTLSIVSNTIPPISYTQHQIVPTNVPNFIPQNVHHTLEDRVSNTIASNLNHVQPQVPNFLDQNVHSQQHIFYEHVPKVDAQDVYAQHQEHVPNVIAKDRLEPLEAVFKKSQPLPPNNVDRFVNLEQGESDWRPVEDFGLYTPQNIVPFKKLNEDVIKMEDPLRRMDNMPESRHDEDVNSNVGNGTSILDEIAEAIEMVDGDSFPNPKSQEKIQKMEAEILKYVDENLSKDTYDIFSGVKIEPVSTLLGRNINASMERNGSPRNIRSVKKALVDDEDDQDAFDTKVIEKFEKYAKNHVLSVNIPQAARFFGFKFGQGKSSFLTGFGLGFLAFGLKKLLLPLFIGAQVVKSVLIAMFLPSILGSLGKIVGKGLSQFSGSSINLTPQGQTEDLEYKDHMGYATDQDPAYTYPAADTLGTLPANAQYGGAEDLANVAMSRFGPGGAKVTYLPNMSDNYYRNGIRKHEDYKVFHNIPASSMLLSNYDPFYSPLLSRLDSVFQRLGLGGGANSPTLMGGPRLERCRERIICHMYAAPAKYAPFSNLVSAQLSRELNELRKPTSDNPEILRFFRYMRAAKDGQEGSDCSRSAPNCPGVAADGGGSVAMIATYNDINKLVSARKLE